MRHLFLSIVRHQQSIDLLGYGIETFRRWSGVFACRQAWGRRSSASFRRHSVGTGSRFKPIVVSSRPL